MVHGSTSKILSLMSTPHKLPALLLAAGAALICGSAQAATYTPGDLLLGFVAGGGTGSDSTLVVNLGPSSGYRDAYDSGSSNLAIANISTQLTAQFGPAWYDRTDLYMSVFGTASSNSTTSALFGGDPARTLYISQARTAAGILGSASSGGWSVTGNTALTGAASGILDTSGRFASTTADVLNTRLAIIPDSDANTLDEFTRPTNNNSFDTFNGGIETAFGAGSWGTYGSAGAVEAALDLYRVQSKNNAPGQYGAGGAIGEGVYKGTFTINQSGTVAFVSPVPEPGSAVMLSLACAGALFRRRRD